MVHDLKPLLTVSINNHVTHVMQQTKFVQMFICTVMTGYCHAVNFTTEQLIFRLHRSTTYIDAVYCYWLSSVVCRCDTLVSPARTAELIEMSFGLRTWLVPGNHVLDEGPDPPWEGAILRGEWGVPLYRDTLRSSVQKRQNRSRCRLGCGLRWAQRIMC